MEDASDTPERNAAAKRALRGSISVQQYLAPSAGYTSFLRRLNGVHIHVFVVVEWSCVTVRFLCLCDTSPALISPV